METKNKVTKSKTVIKNHKIIKTRNRFVAGNWLRGFFEGEFTTIEEAWKYLSKRFLLSYPSSTGRHIYMFIEKENEYGHNQLIICKKGVTEISDNLTEKVVLKRCKDSNHRLL